LDALYQDIVQQGINNVQIIAIGKGQFSNDNSNWTNGNTIPVVNDPLPNDVWINWDANQWDLFFLDSNTDYITDFNINPWNYDAVYDQIIDLIQTMSIPFHAEYPSLLNAYPNPFNPSTNIIFSISHGSYSTISIYDMSGRYFETLSKSYFTPGSYVLQWDASNLASGVYIINFRSGIEIYNKKIVLAK
jgi:hypothetical protein